MTKYTRLDDIPADVAVSVATGIFCCLDFADVHAAIEFVEGRPVRTHEMAGDVGREMGQHLIELYIAAAKSRRVKLGVKP